MRVSINPSGLGSAEIAIQNGGHKLNSFEVEPGASGEVSRCGCFGPNPATVVEPDNLDAAFKGEICDARADSLYDSFPSKHGDHLYVFSGSIETGDWPF